MVRSIAASAALSDPPTGRLKENEVEAELPVWVTDTGVLALARCANADSGTTVSRSVLMAVPVEVLPRPALASELAARLRATSALPAAALALPLPISVVPDSACVACVPDTGPPAVLMYMSATELGFC